MDKLKPILTHKYWIIFVVAMILPTVGWWIATAEVSAQTETAIKAADTAFGSVPGADSPNGTYAAAIQGFNQQLDTKNKKFNRYLWNVQKTKRVWPKVIDDTMQALPYWGEIPIGTRRIYRNVYIYQLNELPKMIDAINIENPIGKVQFDLSTFEPQVSPADWGTSPPDSETMWEVQEDLWLVRSLLSAVAATNAGYDNILQAPIKQIDLIWLRGGSKQPAGGAPGAGGDPAGGGPGPGGPAALPGGRDAGGFGGSGGLFGPRLGAGANGRMSANRGGGQGAGFDPADVFGPDTAPTTGGGPIGEGAGPAAPDAGGPVGFDPFGGPGQQNQPKPLRYIDKEEGAPFKTRGFYMELVMDHSRLPDLMVHLANLDWPVEIVRVQQQIRNPDRVQVVGGGAGAAPGAALPGGIGGPQAGGGLGLGRRGAGQPPFRGGLPAEAAPMGGLRGQGRDDEEQKKAAEGARMYAAAMRKSKLVNVAIAGKLTLFQPPPKSAEPAPEQPAATGGETKSDEPTPTDAPPTTDGAEKPADGTKAEPATTPETTTPAGDPAETTPDNQAETKNENKPAPAAPPATETPDDKPKPENKPSDPTAAKNE